jgi:hypothetical protein
MSRPPWLCRLAFLALLLAVLATISASTVRARAEESQPHLTPQEIRLYDKAQTLIDWTPDEIRTRPELQGLQPAESQQELSPILREVGERVAAFFDDFPNRTSTGAGSADFRISETLRYALNLRASPRDFSWRVSPLQTGSTPPSSSISRSILARSSSRSPPAP